MTRNLWYPFCHCSLAAIQQFFFFFFSVRKNDLSAAYGHLRYLSGRPLELLNIIWMTQAAKFYIFTDEKGVQNFRQMTTQPLHSKLPFFPAILQKGYCMELPREYGYVKVGDNLGQVVRSGRTFGGHPTNQRTPEGVLEKN